VPLSRSKASRARLSGARRTRDVRRWAASRAEIEQLTAELEEQRTILARQSDASLEGVLVISAAGKVLFSNRRYREIWRLPDDIRELDRPALVAIANAQVRDPERFLTRTAAVYEQPDVELTELIELVDGRVLERYTAPVRSDAGVHIGRGWYFRDVTERVRGDAEIRALNAELEQRTAALAAANAELEQRTAALAAANAELERGVRELRQTQDQLLLADRLSSLGRVAASIGHEINNPLSYVIGNLDEVARGDQLSPEARELIGEAIEGSQRVRRIVGELKSIARASTEQREPVDLHATLESTIRMASNELRHRGRLIRDYGELPLIEGDASRLGQVFLNLIVNATHALTGPRDGGHFIAIRTFTRGEQAVIEIEDSGEGIAPDHLSRLFDPFFTTKAVGVGTGLGLSICHGIVSEHGGAIEVSSTLGAGSRFRVVLPGLRGAAPARDAAAARAPEPAGQRRSILIVDDDARVLRSLRRSLARRHEVEACEGATAALAVLAAGRRFDAILCDLHMPGVTGAEFYHRLREQLPGTEDTIIFMTGGAFTAEATQFTRDCPNHTVEKPIDLAEIDKLIGEVAAGDQRARRASQSSSSRTTTSKLGATNTMR
jgi:signal transduction histidine kinase/FixJ family two-component response regulator